MIVILYVYLTPSGMDEVTCKCSYYVILKGYSTQRWELYHNFAHNYVVIEKHKIIYSD